MINDVKINIYDLFGLDEILVSKALGYCRKKSFFKFTKSSFNKSNAFEYPSAIILPIDKVALFCKPSNTHYKPDVPIIAVLPRRKAPDRLPKHISYTISSKPSQFELSNLFQSLYNFYLQIAQHKNEIEKEKSQLQHLNKIGISLSVERNIQKLLETILDYSLMMTQSDAGSIYIVESLPNLSTSEKHKIENQSLVFKYAKNYSRPFPFKSFGIPINPHSIVGYSTLMKKPVNIKDAYEISKDKPYTFNRDFDSKVRYRTQSILTTPMLNQLNDPIGAVQLLNKKTDPKAKLRSPKNVKKYVTSFEEKDESLMFSLASQAAVTYEGKILFEEHKKLLDSLVAILADAIDRKSKYTGAHCSRVPVITKMIAKEACKTKKGALKSFKLNEEEWRELDLAAWLHDCGKVVTPVHVMDKSSKLETITDRIAIVELRFELLKQELLQSAIKNNENLDDLQSQTRRQLHELDEHLEFIKSINFGSEALPQEKIDRVKKIVAYKVPIKKQITPLLTDDEVYNLCIQRGTLNNEERQIINDHISVTIDMLEKLPFPRNLSRIPEYAGAHHEKMDGTGYPRKLSEKDISIPAKIMIIADVFEALTASDRPYKSPKPLSEVMSIMGKMKRDNHFDPDLFNLFITSKVYLNYAKKYLPPNLIDKVDEKALLEIIPDFVNNA